VLLESRTIIVDRNKKTSDGYGFVDMNTGISKERDIKNFARG